MPSIYIGVDISQSHLDLHRPDLTRSWQIPNNAAAITALIAELPDDGHLVFEATSVCDRDLRRQLSAADRRFSRINPRQAREFARAAGYLAKTDRIDARMLSNFGAALRPVASQEPDAPRQRLALLVRRREQLVEMRKQEKTRNRQVDVAEIAQDIAEMIAILSVRIKAIESKINSLINDTPDLAVIDQRLRAVPGIGNVVAATLLAGLPELGHRDRRSIAALAGLAPLANDSGRHHGKRKIWGGRRQVRRVLYIAATTTARRSHFRAYYERLVDNGKPVKVARVATARKILTTINAMIRDKADFNPANA